MNLLRFIPWIGRETSPRLPLPQRAMVPRPPAYIEPVDLFGVGKPPLVERPVPPSERRRMNAMRCPAHEVPQVPAMNCPRCRQQPGRPFRIDRRGRIRTMAQARLVCDRCGHQWAAAAGFRPDPIHFAAGLARMLETAERFPPETGVGPWTIRIPAQIGQRIRGAVTALFPEQEDIPDPPIDLSLRQLLILFGQCFDVDDVRPGYWPFDLPWALLVAEKFRSAARDERFSGESA